MKIIGVTGSSGAGKDTLCEILENKYNAEIVDADKIARELSKKGTMYLQSIVESFGSGIVDRKGELNRKKLASIIYEDDNIIVVNKPSKLLTISNKNEKDNTLYRMVSNYLKKEKKKVFVIHRLDYDTSGVIMFAKNKEVQKLYQSKWNELAKIREYTAVVEGITDNKGHIESYLKQTKTLLVYSSKSKDGYFAVTDYERIMYNNKYSMLKIHISTGRRNQIRCHMHDIKHPILGDSRYNSRYNPLGRLALHANKLVITNPISKKELTFVSKIPLEFYNLVK